MNAVQKAYQTAKANYKTHADRCFVNPVDNYTEEDYAEYQKSYDDLTAAGDALLEWGLVYLEKRAAGRKVASELRIARAEGRLVGKVRKDMIELTLQVKA